MSRGDGHCYTLMQLAGGSYSTYAYAEGNPTESIDPMGLYVPDIPNLHLTMEVPSPRFCP